MPATLGLRGLQAIEEAEAVPQTTRGQQTLGGARCFPIHILCSSFPPPDFEIYYIQTSWAPLLATGIW